MNTRLVERPTPRDSRGWWLKTAVVVPDVIISSLIGSVVIAALPSAVGLGVIAAGVAFAVVLAAGLGEDTVVRILYGARRPTPIESGRLAVPWQIVTDRVDTAGVRLRVATLGAPLATAGRRHVLLACDVVDAYRAGQLTDGEIAALVAHGIGRLRHGRTRFDLVWVLWTWPWDFLRGLVVGAGRRLSWIPVGKFAWQIRFLVGGIAVVLETQAGRWPSPIIITAFITLSYLMPYVRLCAKTASDLHGSIPGRTKAGMVLGMCGYIPRYPGVSSGVWDKSY